jgi:hypothetical protein
LNPGSGKPALIEWHSLGHSLTSHLQAFELQAFQSGPRQGLNLTIPEHDKVCFNFILLSRRALILLIDFYFQTGPNQLIRSSERY